MCSLVIKKMDSDSGMYTLQLEGRSVYINFSSFKIENPSLVSLWIKALPSVGFDVFVSHIFSEELVSEFCRAWRAMKCEEV
jgi:hypothetical protein